MKPSPARTSPATVISLLALFVALGGTAGALKGKNTVDSGDIKNGQVKTQDLAPKSVKSKNIAPGTINSVHIADGSITDKHLAPGAVTANKFSNGAVTDEKLADGAVTPGKIAEVTPAVSLTRSTDQSIVWAGSGADISFNTVRYDTAGSFNNANPTCMSAPIDGIYQITGGVEWEADKDGYRWLKLRKGDGDVLAQALDKALNDSQRISQSVSATVPLAAGDCVKLTVQHNATQTVPPPGMGEIPRELNVKSLTGASGASPSLAMVWVVPGA